MDNREVAGVRRAITWLHEEAKRMNDPHATMILNNAGFHLGMELRKWRGLTGLGLTRAQQDAATAAEMAYAGNIFCGDTSSPFFIKPT